MYDDYSSDDSSGSGSLTDGILQLGSTLGAAAIMASSGNSGTNSMTPMYSRPVYAQPSGMSGKLSSLLMVGALVLLGVFAYRKL